MKRGNWREAEQEKKWKHKKREEDGEGTRGIAQNKCQYWPVAIALSSWQIFDRLNGRTGARDDPLVEMLGHIYK